MTTSDDDDDDNHNDMQPAIVIVVKQVRPVSKQAYTSIKQKDVSNAISTELLLLIRLSCIYTFNRETRTFNMHTVLQKPYQENTSKCHASMS